MIAKYRWKHNPPGSVKAEHAAGEIQRIIKVHGHATPQIIVNEATNPDNPLHNCFEWNEKKAAVICRLNQARYILRQIEAVIQEDEEKEPIRVRAFQNVVEDDNRVYLTIQRARAKPELWEQVVMKARTEIKNWRETYKSIKEFEVVFQAIDQIA